MEDLVDLDEIAYIRFASVYRQFKDMSVFLKELQDIVEKRKNHKNRGGQQVGNSLPNQSYKVFKSRPLTTEGKDALFICINHY